jgi:two-component sensor histidine kinase
MKFFVPLRPLLLGWLLALAVWVALAFVVSFAVVANTPLTWIEAMQAPVRDWLPWTLAAPLLFRFVNRHPLERERWIGRLAAHVAVLACVTGLAWSWARFLDIRPDPGLDRFGGPMEKRFPRFGPHSDDGRSRPDPFWDDEGGPGWDSPPPKPPGERFYPRHSHGPGGPGGPGDPGKFGGGPGAPGSFPRVLGRVLSAYLVLASAAHATFFYRRAKEREASLATARLEALRAQLQPHFLFNTLNTISGLVHSEPERADAVITALGDLLRLTLETSEKRELPLREEMRLVEAYLAIMQSRFEERVNCVVEIAAETREALVPAFVLQPLIENAVRHGLEPLPKGGTVKIAARREGGRLRIEVSDDGVGLRADGPSREGIGLANTRARLRALHGERASMELRAGEGRGCAVVLELPFRTTS